MFDLFENKGEKGPIGKQSQTSTSIDLDEFLFRFQSILICTLYHTLGFLFRFLVFAQVFLYFR